LSKLFAGGNTQDLGAIDGISMWESLSNNIKSPRKQILHNIDDITGYAAIRDTNFKYIKGKLIIYLSGIIFERKKYSLGSKFNKKKNNTPIFNIRCRYINIQLI